MTRPSVADMEGPEVGAVLDRLTPKQLRDALIYISGYSPEALDAALAYLDRSACVTCEAGQ